MAEPQAPAPLIERFPSLRRLVSGKPSKVPFIPQLSNVECGVACVAMVLAYHGKRVAREELRAVLGPTRDGVRAAHLLRVGRHFGLRARGFKGELEALRHVPRGSILHWDFSHYVVLQAVGKAHIDIVDPAMGPRRIPWQDLDKAFTGVVLTFEPGVDFEPGKGKKQGNGLYASLLRAGDWGRIFTISFAVQLVTLALPLLVALIVDRVLPRSDSRLLYVVAGGLTFMVAFYWLTQLVRGHLLLNMRTSLDAKMTMELVERMLSLPYTFFQQRSTGDLILRLNSSKMVREILTSGALSAVLDGSFMVLYLLLLLAMSPIMGIVVIGLGAVNVLVLILLRSRRRAFHAELVERQAACEDYQFEMLNAMQTLKGMGCEERAQERWGDLFVDLLNTQLSYGRLEVVFQSFTAVLRLGAPLVIFTLGALEVLGGSMSVGTMLAVNTFAVGVFDPLSRLVEKLEQFERLGIYVERMMDVHDSPREQPVGLPPVHERLTGSIEFDNVSFRHGPLEQDVIQQLSLTIRPGEFIGVVGASGAGKSTLASLLLGLYQPTEGRVLCDGRSLQEVDLGSVREQIGVVTQDTHLFAGTVRANIGLADPNLSLAKIEHAAKLAQIHDDIIKMPMGYNTLLSNGGGSISGGQRQRIALARALARKPAILVLDEATSALDTRNESGIQEALAQINCTRIVIAHRLSTVAAADRILVLDQGRIVEQGSPLELLQRGAAYARLINQQAGLPASGLSHPRQPLRLPDTLSEHAPMPTASNDVSPEHNEAAHVVSTVPVQGVVAARPQPANAARPASEFVTTYRGFEPNAPRVHGRQHRTAPPGSSAPSAAGLKDADHGSAGACYASLSSSPRFQHPSEQDPAATREGYEPEPEPGHAKRPTQQRSTATAHHRSQNGPEREPWSQGSGQPPTSSVSVRSNHVIGAKTRSEYGKG